MKRIKIIIFGLILCFSSICLAEINSTETKETSGSIQTEIKVEVPKTREKFEMISFGAYYNSIDGKNSFPMVGFFIKPGETKLIPAVKGYYIYIREIVPLTNGTGKKSYYFAGSCHNLAPIIEGRKNTRITILNPYSTDWSSKCMIVSWN